MNAQQQLTEALDNSSTGKEVYTFTIIRSNLTTKQVIETRTVITPLAYEVDRIFRCVLRRVKDGEKVLMKKGLPY